jgi:hypothetical protein
MPRKISFFGQWFGGEYIDRAAINANADELAQVESSIDGLSAAVQRQAAEIGKLRALSVALSQLLVDKGVVTEDELQDLAQRLASPPPPAPLPPPPPPSPALASPPLDEVDDVNDGPPRMGAAEGTTTCDRCGRQVPMSCTNIVEIGTICDDCFTTSPER